MSNLHFEQPNKNPAEYLPYKRDLMICMLRLPPSFKDPVKGQKHNTRCATYVVDSLGSK
jgi:hypothetical protein